MFVRLAIAQTNPTVGALQDNTQALIQCAHDASQQGARLLLTPELSLLGYPPEDLLLRPSFVQQAQLALEHLQAATAHLDLHLVVGHVASAQGGLYNAATVLHKGVVQAVYYKHKLPNTEVFDEQRYFASGHAPCVFAVDGLAFGINICEDLWHPHAPQAAAQAGAQVLLVLNASPFHRGKQAKREAMAQQRFAETGLPVVYANLVGGQDELVFDGGSFVLGPEAPEVAMQLPGFETALACVDIEIPQPQPQGRSLPLPLRFVPQQANPQASIQADSDEAQLYQALCLGVRDYLNKNRFSGALVGLSGGVDSALTLAIAVDALGADRVHAIMMPSPYTAEISWLDARAMAHGLGVRYDEVAIEPCMNAFAHSLEPSLQSARQQAVHRGHAPTQDTTAENIQARIRGTMLMAVSNSTGCLVLTTGNKSEMATGYCTLYGDMAGGFAVLKDLFKTWVYRLCAYRNQLAVAQGLPPVVPERILTRPPSAELRPNQRDDDSLPPYDVLDAILALYMEQNQSVQDIVAAGFKPADVLRAVRLLRINEYKRRQAPVGIRVSPRAFGRDWRYPITSGFDDTLAFSSSKLV